MPNKLKHLINSIWLHQTITLEDRYFGIITIKIFWHFKICETTYLAIIIMQKIQAHELKCKGIVTCILLIMHIDNLPIVLVNKMTDDDIMRNCVNIDMLLVYQYSRAAEDEKGVDKELKKNKMPLAFISCLSRTCSIYSHIANCYRNQTHLLQSL